MPGLFLLLNFRGKSRQKMLSAAPGDILTAENIHVSHKYLNTYYVPETMQGTSTNAPIVVL